MTNNVRVILWAALGLAVYLNFLQWSHDFAPAVDPATAATAGSQTPSIADTVPQGNQKPAVASPSDAVPTAASAPAPAAPETSGQIVHVVTDVLTIDIDTRGGTLVHAELPSYPLVKGEPQPVVLLNTDSPSTKYVLQSGLTDGKQGDAHPTHLANFSTAAKSYTLAPTEQDLRVPLTWTDGQGVTVTKTFVFHRGLFTIGLEYLIDNKSTTPWVAQSYARIDRNDPPFERSYFKVESFAFRGPAIWAPEKIGGDNIYRKIKIDKPDDLKVPDEVQHGWIAGMQHHFATAIVPDDSKKYSYKFAVKGREYTLGAMGPEETVAPGTTKTLKESLFVGPKLQKQLTLLHPELDRVADYSWATPIARPLFWLLGALYSVVKNWGVSIMLATLLLKLLFYPLSEKSGRSMAKMRELAPRLKVMQETYKDDRTKLGQATMELYRAEKVNPVAGCLPMLIQMPVFLAFYWVLLESVEMRQAPFILWINDLSSRDPFFILPALNGLAMWTQYKLNPPPPDPMQAKVFQFMPLVFSVMFAFFPAGLVLYWVTNTGLSILQQWNINRKIARDKLARAR
jgi:YidC/Oxa1 family membrane protein insertase